MLYLEKSDEANNNNLGATPDPDEASNLELHADNAVAGAVPQVPGASASASGGVAPGDEASGGPPKKHSTSDIAAVASFGYKEPGLTIPDDYVLKWDIQTKDMEKRTDALKDRGGPMELSPHFGSFCNAWDMPQANFGVATYDPGCTTAERIAQQPSCLQTFC
eukprot:g12669.t1